MLSHFRKGTRLYRESDSISMEEAHWLLASFCTLQRVAFDGSLFAQRYPPPISTGALAQAADELGLILESKRCSLEWALSWKLPLAVPVIADENGNDASTAAPASASRVVWVLILNADEQRVALLERGATSPVTVEIAEFEKRYLGAVWSFTPKIAAAIDPDGIDSRHALFGLRWFVPALSKHKGIWREVLTASLVLQLIALATPLFTQAIIDKVVVHRTESTLITLGVAMVMFMIFTSVLSWVRQFLVLHTGQRIDAALGAQVFDKLFRLPLQYFQHRPTGVIAARMQGIETIREFIASAAVTLVLDLPFLLIFVGIMFGTASI